MVKTRPALAVANAKYYLERKGKKLGYAPEDPNLIKPANHDDLVEGHGDLKWQAKYAALKAKYEPEEPNEANS